MITVRKPEDIHLESGVIEDGTFLGRWQFSFGDYFDPENRGFGTLRVLNDDTLSPGATWPLHPHRDIEVVTVCAAGEFRHADENGFGGVLKKGWVQHTTVGRGLWHSEINDRKDAEMRFLQMWILPEEKGLEPSVEQRAVERSERTNRFLPLVSSRHPGALPIRQDAAVLACFLEAGKTVEHPLAGGRGAYLYVFEGGPIGVAGMPVREFGAAKITQESSLSVAAKKDAELLLVDVALP
ncbi:MAG: pirin family protein [Methanobacteriota archaeon]|nr:MAG: pirin family protein [Euryarchaeota archaeon]